MFSLRSSLQVQIKQEMSLPKQVKLLKELPQKSGTEILDENNKFECSRLFKKLARLRGDIHQHEAI